MFEAAATELTPRLLYPLVTGLWSNGARRQRQARRAFAQGPFPVSDEWLLADAGIAIRC
jgi:hypothetical protein